MGFEDENKVKYALEKENGKVDETLDKLMSGAYDDYNKHQVTSEVIDWSEKKKHDYQKDLLVPFEDKESGGLVANQFKKFQEKPS